MVTHRATFDVDSKTDALAIERLMDRLYNSVREESRSNHPDLSDSSEMLAEFEALRNAARTAGPGRLTVVYERHDDGFVE